MSLLQSLYKLVVHHGVGYGISGCHVEDEFMAHSWVIDYTDARRCQSTALWKRFFLEEVGSLSYYNFATIGSGMRS